MSKQKPENAIVKIDKTAFDEALKRKMIDKYLDDVVDLRKAIHRTRKLLTRLEGYNQEIEDGNWDAVEKYKKLKTRISSDLSIDDES